MIIASLISNPQFNIWNVSYITSNSVLRTYFNDLAPNYHPWLRGRASELVVCKVFGLIPTSKPSDFFHSYPDVSRSKNYISRWTIWVWDLPSPLKILYYLACKKMDKGLILETFTNCTNLKKTLEHFHSLQYIHCNPLTNHLLKIMFQYKI